MKWYQSAEGWRNFFLYSLVFFMPFSIAGDDVAIVGLYLSTIYLFAKGKEKGEKSILQYGMLFFFTGIIFSTLMSPDVAGSFHYYRKFWRFALPFIVFWTLRKQVVESYLKVLFYLATIIAFYGLLQYFTGLDVLRSGNFEPTTRKIHGGWYTIGVFSHHLTYGGVFLIISPLMLAPIFSTVFSKKERLILGLFAFISFASVITSMGRSSFLGSLTGIAVILFFRKPKVVASLLVLGAVFLIGVASNLDYIKKETNIYKHPMGERFLTIFEKNRNSDRFNMWTAGERIIRDNPITGVGPKNVKAMQPYYDQVEKETGQKFQHGPSTGVHNIYIQNWVDFGLIGIAGYLFMWLSLLFQGAKTVFKSKEDTKEKLYLIGAIAGLAGSMVAGNFENNFRDGEVQAVIFFTMGVVLTLIYQLKKKTN